MSSKAPKGDGAKSSKKAPKIRVLKAKGDDAKSSKSPKKYA